MRGARKVENLVLTVCGLTAALVWIFPIYWAVVTSLRSESHVVSDDAGLLPDGFNLTAFTDALFNTQIVRWYFNSIGTALIITIGVIVSCMMCAYAISQMRFPVGGCCMASCWPVS